MASFQLIAGANPCDTCTNMQGIYPYEPHVPIHKNCDCRVEDLGGERDCQNEVRNVRVERSAYSETRERGSGEISGPLPADETRTVPVPLGEEVSAWDAVELRDAAGWPPTTSGSEDIEVTFTAGSVGNFRLTVDLAMEEVMAMGELWEVCLRPPGTDGISHIDERNLGEVAGYGVARTDVHGYDIEFETAPLQEEEYFEDDDEVPL